MDVFDKTPIVDRDAFVAPSASVIGDVQIGHGSSIWYGCVLRGKLFNILSILLREVLFIVRISAVVPVVTGD